MSRKIKLPWWFQVLSLALVMLAIPFAAPKGEEEREAAMLAGLRNGSAEERREALGWLAKNAGGKSVEPIVASLRDGDAIVRELAENALWSIWARSGDRVADEMLKLGTHLMVNGNLNKSVEVFSQIIEDHPEFAEGYNKRATAWYLLGAYDESLADIHMTLERNRFHFGALSGAGYCMLKMERMDEAVAYMERALRINPNLESLRSLIREAKKSIPKKAI